MTKEQTATFRTALQQAREAFSTKTVILTNAEKETARLKEEIRNLRRTITALAALCSENPNIDKLGITDVCMEAMNTLPYTASTADVVQWIEMYGYDISSQKNAEASVHAVLTRLAKDEKITKLDTEEGVRWRGPSYDPELDEAVKEAVRND